MTSHRSCNTLAVYDDILEDPGVFTVLGHNRFE